MLGLGNIDGFATIHYGNLRISIVSQLGLPQILRTILSPNMDSYGITFWLSVIALFFYLLDYALLSKFLAFDVAQFIRRINRKYFR